MLLWQLARPWVLFMIGHYYILEHLKITNTTLYFTSVLKFKHLSHILQKLQERCIRAKHVLFRNILNRVSQRLSVSLEH